MSSATSSVAVGSLSTGITGSAERQGKTGEMLQGNVHGKHYEQTARGGLFYAYSGSAGLAITAAGTTPGFALFNPVGSGVNVGIIEVSLFLVSGTMVLGGLVHALNTNLVAAASTGTAVTVVNALAGNKTVAAATPLSTVTLPTSPTGTRVFGEKNATAATSNHFTLRDYVDGALGLAPGATWSMFSVGADTTPLWGISICWEEIPAY